MAKINTKKILSNISFSFAGLLLIAVAITISTQETAIALEKDFVKQGDRIEIQIIETPSFSYSCEKTVGKVVFTKPSGSRIIRLGNEFASSSILDRELFATLVVNIDTSFNEVGYYDVEGYFFCKDIGDFLGRLTSSDYSLILIAEAEKEISKILEPGMRFTKGVSRKATKEPTANTIRNPRIRSRLRQALKEKAK